MRTPAGLLDSNFEYFVEKNEVYALMNGKKLDFNQVPKRIEDIFFNEFVLDIDFIASNGNACTRHLFKKWVALNYGLLNEVPDLDTSTGKTTKENIQKDYRLSNREVEVIKEVATGNPDKWSCEELEIKLFTFRQHVKHILQKLNLHSKAGITRFAFENHIL